MLHGELNTDSDWALFAIAVSTAHNIVKTAGMIAGITVDLVRLVSRAANAGLYPTVTALHAQQTHSLQAHRA